MKIFHIRLVDFSPLILIGICAFLGLTGALDYLHGRQGDFPCFYYAAAAARTGKEIYAAANGTYIYPPAFAYVLAPITWLTYPWAGAIWAVINTAIIFITSLMIARFSLQTLAISYDRSKVFLIAGLGLLIMVDKARAVVFMGQTDALVLLLCTLALIWIQKRPVRMGLALGAAIVIKYQALALVPYLIVRRKFLAAASALATFSAFLLAPALIVGWKQNIQYLHESTAVLSTVFGNKENNFITSPHGLLWDRSVSITSAMSRWANASGHALAIGQAGAAFLAFLILIGVVLLYRAHGLRLFKPEPTNKQHQYPPLQIIEWSGVLIAVLIFSPQTAARHMYLATLLTIFAVALLGVPKQAISQKWIFAAFGLILAGLYLPPGGEKFANALHWWRQVGGASWCMLTAYLLILWQTVRWASYHTADASE